MVTRTENLVKFRNAVFEIYEVNRQTDRQTDRLMAILGGVEVKMMMCR